MLILLRAARGLSAYYLDLLQVNLLVSGASLYRRTTFFESLLTRLYMLVPICEVCSLLYASLVSLRLKRKKYSRSLERESIK